MSAPAPTVSASERTEKEMIFEISRNEEIIKYIRKYKKYTRKEKRNAICDKKKRILCLYVD